MKLVVGLCVCFVCDKYVCVHKGDRMCASPSVHCDNTISMV